MTHAGADNCINLLVKTIAINGIKASVINEIGKLTVKNHTKVHGYNMHLNIEGGSSHP